MMDISPKYQMQLVDQIDKAIWDSFGSYKKVKSYILKWHVVDADGWNNYTENFSIINKATDDIDLHATLHNIDGQTLLKIAIDIGVETPDFIPSIPQFKNELKTNYETAASTFERALKNVEEHPDTSIGLANSALESIIKEILKDTRLSSKLKGGETLYSLSSVLLREFRFTSSGDLPEEIKSIGRSLIAINQSIEKLRSEKTSFHGKTSEDYVIKDSLYAYFIVNSVTTIGKFLMSYYTLKFPKVDEPLVNDEDDELPF